MELVAFLLQREAIVAAAILGALLAVAGSLGMRRPGGNGAAALVKIGYGLTGFSMLLMIVAGFMSGR